MTDLDTGVCVVLVEPSAERSFVTTRAAERHITVESLGSNAPVAGDLVCVSGYTLFAPTREPLLAWLEGLAEGYWSSSTPVHRSRTSSPTWSSVCWR